jgi:hypothetical protein
VYNRHILIIHKIFNKHIRKRLIQPSKFQKISKNKKGYELEMQGAEYQALAMRTQASE